MTNPYDCYILTWISINFRVLNIWSLLFEFLTYEYLDACSWLILLCRSLWSSLLRGGQVWGAGLGYTCRMQYHHILQYKFPRKCYIGKTNKTFIKIRNFLTYGLILITGCKTECPCNLDTFLSTKTMVKGKAWPALSAWEASSTSNVKSRSICSRTATKKNSMVYNQSNESAKMF